MSAFRATGPPVNSSAGGVASGCHWGSSSPTATPPGSVDDHAEGPVVAVVEDQHHPAGEVGVDQPRRGHQQVAGQRLGRRVRPRRARTR